MTELVMEKQQWSIWMWSLSSWSLQFACGDKEQIGVTIIIVMSASNCNIDISLEIIHNSWQQIETV